jgi:acyl-coenzyme A thioesterase PaaI-like protein
MSDDIAAPASFEVPEGYTALDWRRGFVRQIGPLYRRQSDRGYTFGFRVEDHHTNGMKNAHGGMLMSFADMAWGHVVSVETSSYWVTVRLTLDFLSSAHDYRHRRVQADPATRTAPRREGFHRRRRCGTTGPWVGSRQSPWQYRAARFWPQRLFR